MEEIEAFRYRSQDAWRAVTRIAVREARLAEIKQEMMHCKKLRVGSLSPKMNSFILFIVVFFLRLTVAFREQPQRHGCVATRQSSAYSPSSKPSERRARLYHSTYFETTG